MASDAYAVKVLFFTFYSVYSVNSDDASEWILSFVMQTAKTTGQSHTQHVYKHCCVVIYFGENNCPNYRNERYNSVKYFQPIDLFRSISYDSLHSYCHFLSLFAISPEIYIYFCEKRNCSCFLLWLARSFILSLSRSLTLIRSLFKMWNFLIGKVNESLPFQTQD